MRNMKKQCCSFTEGHGSEVAWLVIDTKRSICAVA